MKNTIELYIAGKLVDLSDDSLVLWTYQKTDYTHPTAIKNTYTKTITIPGTQNNNQVFNTIYKLDRLQTSAIFDPSKRTPFQIFKAGDLIEEGYCRLDNINSASGYVSYSLTLYGGLGDFMYGLTYDDDGNKLNLSDLKYGDRDIEFRITADAILQAWSRLHTGKLDTETEDYEDTRFDGSFSTTQFDVINFAPCYNGIPENENFDPSKVFVSEWYRNPYNYLSASYPPKPIAFDYRPWQPTVKVEVSDDDNYTYETKTGWLIKKKKEVNESITAPYVNIPITGLKEFDNSGTKSFAKLRDYPIDWKDNSRTDTTVYRPVRSERLKDTRIPTGAVNDEKNLSWGVLNLKESATEWQTRDLRSYMQRPVIRVQKLFEAIQRYAQEKLGYTVELDPNFFNSQNEYYSKSWITLSLLNEQENSVKSGDFIGQKTGDKVIETKVRTFEPVSGVVIPDIVEEYEYNTIGILENTDTPADYLTSYLKLYNLHIICSRVDRKITIMTRDKFYFKSSTVVDLENKVDRSSMEINPLNFDFKYLKLKYEEADSELLKDYREQYGNLEYGCRRWDTGYEFDNGAKEEPEKFIFRNALDALEKDTFYSVMWSGGGANEENVGPQGSNGYNQLCYTGIYPACMNGNGMSWSLFSPKSQTEAAESDVKFSEEERSIVKVNGSTDYPEYNGTTLRIGPTFIRGYENEEYNDSFPKPQFHTESNKPSDGKNVLLFFNQTAEPLATSYTVKNSVSGGAVIYAVGDGGTTSRDEAGWATIPNPYFLTDDIIRENNDIPVINAGTGKFEFFTPGDNGGMKEVLGTRCWVQPQFIVKNHSRSDIIAGTGGDDETTPLWDGGYTLYYIPMFNRSLMNFETKTIESTFDIGQPKTLYYPQFTEPEEATITKKYNWEEYLKDVFNVNTREIKCNIILDEPDEALRRFYYFDGAHWILTRLSDYDYNKKFNSATFIKVNSLSNYSTYLLIDTPRIDFNYTSSQRTVSASYGGLGSQDISIEPLSDWIMVENIQTKAGEGDDDWITTFSISTTENISASSRSGLVSINYAGLSQVVEVKQTASGDFAITYNNIPNPVPYDGGSYIIEAKNTTGITPVISSPPWVNTTTTINPDGSIKIDVRVDENSGNNRTGDITITVGDKEIKVPVNQSVDSGITITSNNIPNPVPSDGGNYTFTGSWFGNGTPDISTVSSWIHLTPVLNPDKTFTVDVSVDENSSTSSRQGIISVGVSGKTITLTVNQSGNNPDPGPDPETYYTLTINVLPDSATITFDEGDEEFTLTINASPDSATITFDVEPEPGPGPTPPDPPVPSEYWAEWVGGVPLYAEIGSDLYTDLSSPIRKDDYSGNLLRISFVGDSALSEVISLDSQYIDSFSDMFGTCYNLTTIPQINTSLGKTFSMMFYGCTKLTSIPEIDTSNGISFIGMFSGCTSLTSIPQINTSNGTEFSQMFAGCSNLIEVPQLNVSKARLAVYVSNMFYGCSKLTTLGGLIGLKYSISFEDCPLTYQSALNVLNGLATVTTDEVITFKSSTYNTLSASDKAIATSKGWKVVSA